MQISLSQREYRVRDASEVALGLFLLGAFGVLLSWLLALLVALILASLISWEKAALTIPMIGTLLWLTGMIFLVRHYLRMARKWSEQRRGSGALHLIEAIGGLFLLVMLFLPTSGGDPTQLYFRVFFAALAIALTLSHVLTYGLLRYRPRKSDLTAWCLAAIPAAVEIARNT